MTESAANYRFDDIEVVPAAHRIVRAGAAITVEPKAFAVLVALLAQAGQMLTRDELLDQVWGHRHVTPGVLNRVIAQLRKALADDALHPRYIQTVHSLGYRFMAEVVRVEFSATGTVTGTPTGTATGTPTGTLTGTTTESATSVATAATAASSAAASRERRRLNRRFRRRAEATDTAAAAPVVAPAAAATASTRSWWKSRRRPLLWVAATLALAVVLAMVWRPRWLQPPLPAASVAVLPFANLGEGADDDYFAQGLTTEIHDALTSIDGLKVAALLSPQAAKQWQSPQAIGRAQGVATVLDASVRRDGARLRISAHLSDTENGYLLWSQVYDRTTAAVFDTQSEIANEVVHALQGVLPAAEQSLTKRLKPTSNLQAFDAYLKGLHAQAGSPQGADQAIAHFNDALESDRSFVAAQVGICRARLWRFESSHDVAALDAARGACMLAERMDRSSPLVRLALGDLYRINGEAERALGYYRPLLDDPARRSAALVGMARLEADAGRQTIAIELLWQALDTRPGDASIYAELGYQQYRGGDLAEATRTYARVIELRPGDADDLGTYGAMLLAAGERELAGEALQRSVAIRPSAATLSNLATLRYQAGDHRHASELYRQATELEPENYLFWGYLGDSLRTDPAQHAESRAAYAEASRRLLPYLQTRPNDAQAIASHGWYQANLEQTGLARQYAELSGSMPTDLGQVAILNAQTYAVLGDLEAARKALVLARARGVDRIQIDTNQVFRQAGLITSQPPVATGR